MESSKVVRIHMRWTIEQKALFERAAALGGFKSLSDFVVQALSLKAEEMVTEHDRILVSERDRETFFDALMNPPAPNEALQAAAKCFMQSGIADEG